MRGEAANKQTNIQTNTNRGRLDKQQVKLIKIQSAD